MVYEGWFYFFFEDFVVGFELGCFNLAIKELMVQDLNFGGSSFFNFFNVVGDYIWFIVNDGISDSWLWWFDLVSGIVENMVYESFNGFYFSINLLIYMDGCLFFWGFVLGMGDEFYVYDIVSNILLDLLEIYIGLVSSSLFGFMVYEGDFYFFVCDLVWGMELCCFNM